MTPTLTLPPDQQLTILKRIHARARHTFSVISDACKTAIRYAEENGHAAHTCERILRQAQEFYAYADAQVQRAKEDFMEKRGAGLEEWME